MQNMNIKKLAIIAAATCGLGFAMSSPSQAREMAYQPYYAAQSADGYQNPDGTYNSLADLSRDVQGVPCGIECTQRAEARWAHYGEHPYDGE